MPKVTIDNLEIEVAEGTKIIAAAERLGIMIPRFCYHPALGSVGACRVCAVKVENAGRLSGIQMSCMIDALDGMVVTTDDPEAVAFRHQVIEWLMLNHPHDCPVCDEGGHCVLQDYTVSCDHGIRRYEGRKRTYANQYLGPLVEHEMNRCIQCYRCSRYYQEFAGYRDLGVMGIAERVFFGRFSAGVLESPFAGNLIDVCPTGVYTDKPSRYTGRRWDFERSESVCIHCSLGCNTTVSARYRAVVRQEGRYSPVVNGHFICDRGRYGFYYANHPERPWNGRIDGAPVHPGDAVTEAVARLKTAEERFGARAVAAVGSSRGSLEALHALRGLCKENGWQEPAFFSDRFEALAVRTAANRLAPEIAISMKEIEGADCVVVVGADILAEAPMLALAVRQAVRAGAYAAAIDPRPLDWPFACDHVPAAPGDLEKALQELEDTLEGGAERPARLTEWEALAPVATALSESRKPVIICGSALCGAEIIAKGAELTWHLREGGRVAGFFPVLPGANSFGCALLDESGKGLEDVIEGIETGNIRALIAVEADMADTFHDSRRLVSALAKLELLVALDYVHTDHSALADIYIPTRTVFETGGIYVNQEGRAQAAVPVHNGGIPISQTGQGGHPPRFFRRDTPGADAQTAWKILHGWRNRDEADAQPSMRDEMYNDFPALRGLSAEGVRLLYAAGDSERTPRHQENRKREDEDFRLLTVPSVFGDEPLSRRSRPLQELEKQPELWMNEVDAANMGISEAMTVTLTLAHQPLELTARLSDRVARKAVVLPRLHSIFWQQMTETGGGWLKRGHIQPGGK
jgi:NADH-quinone oxidoreductase subunit G